MFSSQLHYIKPDPFPILAFQVDCKKTTHCALLHHWNHFLMHSIRNQWTTKQHKQVNRSKQSQLMISTLTGHAGKWCEQRCFWWKKTISVLQVDNTSKVLLLVKNKIWKMKCVCFVHGRDKERPSKFCTNLPDTEISHWYSSLPSYRWY